MLHLQKGCAKLVWIQLRLAVTSLHLTNLESIVSENCVLYMRASASPYSHWDNFR